MSLVLESVMKRVGQDTHIHALDLTLEPGGFNVLLGPTLAGKTTLMRLMAGLERPTSGRVLFNGADVTGVPVAKRNVAMVYQQFINYPMFSVFDNIASPLKISRVPADEINKRVMEVSELLKLTPMLERKPSELSGGQQQRTALARAIVKDAELVLLDEPLANLDYKLREELREELPRLFSTTGATVVYATAEPNEALLLGGQVATLSRGTVTQFAPTMEAYRQPVDLETAMTFSDPPINTAWIDLDDQGFSIADLSDCARPAAWQNLDPGRYRVGFRPHQTRLTDGLAAGHADREQSITVNATVDVTEISGSESFVHIGVGDDQWVAQASGAHRFEIGERIPLYLMPSEFLVFDDAGKRIDTSY